MATAYDLSRGSHDDIDADRHVGQQALDLDLTGTSIGRFVQDDQQIDIAPLVRLAGCTGAEEADLDRLHSLGDALGHRRVQVIDS